METDSQRFLDPEVISRISSLELRAREIVEGTISGRHRSPYHGQSVEFAQHREYTAGDEIRHLDWKVWAKSDRFYVKQFEEETNLRTTLLLDVSSSMSYGSGNTEKYQYACRLAAALSYLLLRQSDSVGLVTFDDDIRTEVPHRSAQVHLRAILHAMATDSPAQKTDFEKILRRITDRDRKRGMMIVLSDLLADRQSVIRGLKLLRGRRHDVIVLHLLHPDEVHFRFQGNTRFEGLEDPLFLRCDPRSLREDYLAALSGCLSEFRRAFSRAGIDYRQVTTNEPAEVVLASMLHERSRR